MLSPKGFARRWAVLIAGDAGCSALSTWLSVRLTAHPAFALESTQGFVTLAAMMAAVHLGAVYLQDLYRFDEPRGDSWVAASTVMVTVKLALILGLLDTIMPATSVGRMFLVGYIASSGVILVGWRLGANRFFLSRMHVRVMALGFNESAPLMIGEITRRHHLGYRFTGFATLGDSARAAAGVSARIDAPIHRTGSLCDLARRYRVDTLVVLDEVAEPGAMQELMRCRVRGTRILDFESFYERIAGKLPVPYLRGSWLLFAPGFTGTQWRRALKRTIDIAAAAALGIALAPVAALTALAVRIDSPGPALYSQDRMGLDGRVFRVYKFRSMRVDAERGAGAVWATADDPRVTRVGRVIRRLRFDELPQLFNVLRGDMSLVGPRPERPEMVEQLDQEIPFYHLRHVVRPGLTGWAQICFPYGASIEEAREKLCYDLYYIKNWSLFFELQIMLQTFKVMLFGRGAR